MSKSKPSDWPRYELLSLISNQYSESELEPIKSKILNLIEKENGLILNQDFWGKRRLAYQIKGFYHGYYFLVEFEVEPSKLEKINQAIRLSAEILRHQIVKIPKLTDEQKKLLQERRNVLINGESTKKVAEKEEEVLVTKKEDKIDIQDLDQKLEKLLDPKDLL